MMVLRKLFLFLACFLFVHFTLAQSLSPVIRTKNKKVDELCAKARELMLSSENSLAALKAADEAKQVAIENEDALATAKANATLGWIFLNNDNLDAAKSFVDKAFKNIEGKNFPEAEGMLDHQIAIIFDKKSETKNALDHYFKAFQSYQDAKNYDKQGQVAGEIARLYLMTKDEATAKTYDEIQRDILAKHPNPALQLNYNNRHIYTMMGQGKFEEAYKLSLASLHLAQKNKIDKEIPNFYYSAAGALFEMGNISEADKNITLAIDYAKRNKLFYGDYLVGKSQILQKQGKTAEIEPLLLNSIESLSKKKEKFMEMQARDILRQYYLDSGQKEKAVEQMLANNAIKDSISSVQQAVKLKEVEYQYKDEEKEKLLESYKTAATQKNWIIGLATLLLLGALYSFFNVRKNLKLKQSLFLKKEKLLESEKENAIQQKILAEKEEEKALLNEKLLLEEQKTLKLEKDNTDRELASITLYVQEKNKMMEELQEKMSGLLQNSSAENRPKLLDISRDIKQSISFEKDWDKIKLHFEKVHPQFFTRMAEICPQLTQNELKHCAYIKMNMNNKETANLLGVDYNSVKMSRYRIKKKLGLSQEEDLLQFIHNI